MDSLQFEHPVMGLDSCNDITSLPSPPASETSYINPQDVTKIEPLDIDSLSTTASTYEGSPEPSESHSPDSPSSSDPSALPKKKRKSWGQVLPEPTTNLPPRKRAKTEAEKEQRKYERVQRNRQAAHNSRMRKQQEMDNLTTRNKELESLVAQLQARINVLEGESKFGSGDALLLPLSPNPSISNWSLPEQVPSLDGDVSSPSDSSTNTLDLAPTPPAMKIETDALFMKQSDDAHSAADVGFAFGMDSVDFFGPVMNSLQSSPEVNMDNFLNFDEFSDSLIDSSVNTDLFADLMFDFNTVNSGNNNASTFNLDEEPLFATSVDPPMFSLPNTVT